jgi:hypothetical protein
MTEPLPAFHRAKCPACSALCEQRRRSVLLPNSENVWDMHAAYECLECEAIYLPAAQESAPVPGGNPNTALLNTDTDPSGASADTPAGDPKLQEAR